MTDPRAGAAVGKKMRTAVVGVAVLVALQGALLLLYFTRNEAGSEAQGLERVAPEVPELVWETADGRRRALSDLRGGPVLVHVWATWCPPCREELPGLLEWSEGAPLQIVAVSVDRGWPEVRDFVGDPLPAAVVRAESDAVTRAFATQALPETWLIDADGRTRARLRGAGDWSSERLRDAITGALE